MSAHQKDNLINGVSRLRANLKAICDEIHPEHQSPSVRNAIPTVRRTKEYTQIRDHSIKLHKAFLFQLFDQPSCARCPRNHDANLQIMMADKFTIRSQIPRFTVLFSFQTSVGMPLSSNTCNTWREMEFEAEEGLQPRITAPPSQTPTIATQEKYWTPASVETHEEHSLTLIDFK